MARTLALTLLVLATASCGGEDKGRPQAALPVEAGPVDPCPASSGLQFQNIADFEGEVAQCDFAVAPPTDMTSSPQCFYLNYDESTSPRPCVIPDAIACLQPSGEQVPDDVCLEASKGGKVFDSKIEGGRCGSSTSAFHYVAKNVAVCISPVTKREGWGATLQATFNWTPSGVASGPYDAKAWDGISFWVRLGQGPSGSALLVSVQDVFSAVAVDPTAGTGKSYCQSMVGVADSEKCDPFGAAVLMTSEWRFVKLPFERLQQKGFGVPSPTGRVDKSALVGVQFAIGAGSWDFWIDDLAFYQEAQ